MEDPRIEFLKRMLDELRRLTSMEKKLMLAFLEHKSVKIKQLLSLSRTYGISGIDLLRTLISLMNRNLVIPVFYFPEDTGALLTRVPFANLFLSFDHVIDVSSLSRRWRDKLEGIINEFKRECEESIADIGIFTRPTITPKGGIWAIVRKFYESARPREILDHIMRLHSIHIPNENIRDNVTRMISYTLLGLWMAYYLATSRSDADPIKLAYPQLLAKLNETIESKVLKNIIMFDREYLDRTSERFAKIFCFVCDSINEAYFSGIEIEKNLSEKIIGLISRGLVLLEKLKPRNLQELKQSIERSKRKIQY